MGDIKIGSRVRVKRGSANGFLQPWRGRFIKGVLGTVVSLEAANIPGVLVSFDTKRAKYPSHWTIVLRRSDLEVLSTEEETK